MTEKYLRNTTADHITGVISACEGIKNSMVLINGPLGCKFYHGYASGQSLIRASELWNLRGDLRLKDAMADSLLRSQYFAGTAQIPGTNLRYEDFIFGTAEQLERALSDIFAERRYSLFAVIQAPGTSLLSESLEPVLQKYTEKYQVPGLYIQTTGLSEDMFTGYDETVVKLLRMFADKDGRKRSHSRPRVNIFGLYTYDRYLEGNLEELRKMLDLCGVDINCAVCADCSAEQLKNIADADLNIYLGSERCQATKKYMESVYDIPSLQLNSLPVGPDLSELFIRRVCELCKTDAAAALECTERTRARIFYYIARHCGSSGFPKDFRYAAEGEPSLLLGIADYLSGYLGIRPDAIHPLYTFSGRTSMPELEKKLADLGSDEALKKDIESVKDVIVLGNANTIAQIAAFSGNVYGIETAYPSSGYINVVSKALIGPSGALYILEQILNGKRLLDARR